MTSSQLFKALTATFTATNYPTFKTATFLERGRDHGHLTPLEFLSGFLPTYSVLQNTIRE
jgi:hypothetical protein